MRLMTGYYTSHFKYRSEKSKILCEFLNNLYVLEISRLVCIRSLSQTCFLILILKRITITVDDNISIHHQF
jgi:hypothetical protein